MKEKKTATSELMFIYLIQNKINKKGYVGQTIRHVEGRIKDHQKYNKKKSIPSL